MDRILREALASAIKAYDYPAVTFDFVQERQIVFATAVELDKHFDSLLQTNTLPIVKNALSGIIYRGHYMVGFKDYRVRRFREAVTGAQLVRAIETFRILEGSGLTRLKGLEISPNLQTWPS